MSQLIFEKSVKGHKAYEGKLTVPEYKLDSKYLRKTDAELPEVSELEFVRHYMELSQKTHGVDNGFYPLGSCTMKYNPKVNEEVASMGAFANIHPLQPEHSMQGCIEVMGDLGSKLSEITGMDAFSLQPSAGAHGEFTALLVIRAYHAKRGDNKRNKILVPDSAHGTNPASAAMVGCEIVNIPSDKDGNVDIEELKKAVGDDTAALMLTNPNTLGLFEKHIKEIAKIVHDAGGVLYYDGANLNAIMGRVRPGDMGYDIVHLNLHKTFSTPHGGGGPGSGPIGCKKFLEPFLPTPVVVGKEGSYKLDFNRPDSIGRVRNFYGNFLVYLKAYAYIITLGAEGIKESSGYAVLNANYLKKLLEKDYKVAFDRICMHEFVLSLENIKHETEGEDKHGVSALDIAKGLIDYGIHPPTMYFPLIVHEALMFEPTETESKATLDYTAEVMSRLKKEAYENPEKVHGYPYTKPISRVDETKAAREPILRYKK